LILVDRAKEQQWLSNKTMLAHTLRKHIAFGYMNNLRCLDGCMSLKLLKVVKMLCVVLNINVTLLLL
jgi:hypothetical protein